MDTFISDCDGVLVNTEEVSERILIERLSEFFPKEQLSQVIRPLLGARLDDVLITVGQHFNRPIDPAMAQEVRMSIEYSLMDEMPPIEGVGAAMRAVPFAKKAIVSNGMTEHMRRAVQANGLEDVFGEHIYSANLVSKPKPAPDIYLYAADKLGSKPENCLVIEDSRAGVTAAVAAGMTVIGFAGGNHVMADHAERLMAIGAAMVIDHMAKLGEAIKILRGRGR